MIKIYYKGEVLFCMPDNVTPVQLFAAWSIIQDKRNLKSGYLSFKRSDVNHSSMKIHNERR